MRDVLRGAFRLHVLHHAAADGGVYGAFLSTRLAELGYPISPGTVYPTLHRMEAEGLLEASEEVVDGHSRKVYTITPAGRDALRHGKGVLAGLAEEVLDQRPLQAKKRQSSTSGDVDVH